MNKLLLTFEINDKQESIEIHANALGIHVLIEQLQKALKTSDHQHLMTDEWGGQELSSEKQGFANRFVHHIKIIPWDTSSSTSNKE